MLPCLKAITTHQGYGVTGIDCPGGNDKSSIVDGQLLLGRLRGPLSHLFYTASIIKLLQMALHLATGMQGVKQSPCCT